MNETTNIDLDQIGARPVPPGSLEAVHEMLKGDASCARVLALTAADFEPMKDTEFSVEADGQSYRLKLVDVIEKANLKILDDCRAPFSLQFLGPKEPILAQRIYPFAHDKMDALEIFIVPIGQEGDNTRYEAIFN